MRVDIGAAVGVNLQNDSDGLLWLGDEAGMRAVPGSLVRVASRAVRSSLPVVMSPTCLVSPTAGIERLGRSELPAQLRHSVRVDEPSRYVRARAVGVWLLEGAQRWRCSPASDSLDQFHTPQYFVFGPDQLKLTSSRLPIVANIETDTATRRNWEVRCDEGHFCIGGERFPCPKGRFGDERVRRWHCAALVTSPLCAAGAPSPSAAVSSLDRRCERSRVCVVDCRG